MPFKKKKIAIVGMACRLPGNIQSPDDYWQVLKKGEDVVTSIDESRWGTDFYQHPNKKEPGKSYTFAAGVLSQIDQFDASFFGISPREAAQMDPQQRLLLELTWEALENGGQLPENLAGSKCAVYIGIASTDYAHRRMDDLSSLDPYSMTGNTASIASNRISYLFDLHGPSVSVDTACSSSLVALHQACSSIWNGDAPMAIAGGVNMLLHPFGFVGFSKASMLSPRGRCHAFDDGGDGYVRSEGSGILFLKKLEDAIADGDPIQAVILESGINSDGQTNGISLPSAKGQAALLTEVYNKAGFDPNELSYIEAHGTGTAVGDPIETSAISKVLAASRKKPLPIGSAKTNVGHLETASGMAGIFKVIMSLKNRALPKSLHFDTPNKNIDFKAAKLQVVTRFTPLKKSKSPLLMGVNSFGFGGANAHVLLEEYIQGETAAFHTLQKHYTPPLFLSANSKPALRATAQQYLDLLETQNNKPPEDIYYDIAFSVAHYRQPLKHGLAFNGNSYNDIRSKLRHFIDDKTAAGITTSNKLNPYTTSNKKPKLALVFSGNGSQWQGMGCELLQTEPLFRSTVEKIDQLLTAHADDPISLIDEFTAKQENSRLEFTEIAQLLLFTLQVGIIKILQAHGLKADACVGHSVGEVSAAWAAGALTLEQAVEVIYERSHAQGETKGSGRMAATGMGNDAMQELLQSLQLQDVITIAGINGPNATTLSGSLADLQQLETVFTDKQTFYRILDLDYAFHSPEMLPIEKRVKATLDGLMPQKGDIRFVSTVTGDVLEGDNLDATYWWENIRKPVLFHKAMDTLIDDDFNVFLEIGPHPILRSYINDCCRHKEIKGLSLASQTKTASSLPFLLDGLYSSYLAGCYLNKNVLFPKKGNYIQLPNYPWQREKHWYTLTEEGADLVNRKREHPLLGYRMQSSHTASSLSIQWENQLDTHKLAYLQDHVVDGGVIFPAAGYVEMALAASSLGIAGENNNLSHEIENLEIKAPIVLDSTKTTRFTLLIEDGSFTIESRDRLSDNLWTLNVVGRLLGSTTRTAPACLDISASIKQTNKHITSAGHYQLTESVGLSYGNAFQGIESVWVCTQTSALAKLKIPTEIRTDYPLYHLHPAMLDAGFQALVDVFSEDIADNKQAALIPVQIGKLYCYSQPTQSARHISYLQVTIKKQSPQSVVADFLLLNAEGEIHTELRNCRFKGVQFTQSRQQDPASYVFNPWLMPQKSQQAIVPKYDLTQLAQHLKNFLIAEEPQLNRKKHYQEIAPLFDVLITAFAWQGIRQLHTTEEPFSVEGWVENNTITAHYEPLLHRLLQLLAEDNLADEQQGYWTLSADSDLPEANDIWLSILGDSPAYLPELMLLGRCGTHLAKILQGKQASTDLLKPSKSSIQSHWYHASKSYSAINQALIEAIKQIVAQRPQNRRLRILEIGAANTELSRQLLPLLPAEQCDYLYTHASEDVVSKAGFELEEWLFAKVQTLDIEQTINTETDTIALADFDLIIANHTLYPIHNLALALNNIQQLLAPQGMLLLQERPPSSFTDFTLGLDADWWKHTETTDKPLSLLLNQHEWKSALEQAGFENITAVTEPESLGDDASFLIMATTTVMAASSNKTTKAAEDTNRQIWMLLTDSSSGDQELDKPLSKKLSALLASRQQHVLLVEVAKSFKQLDNLHYQINIHEADAFDPLFTSLKREGLLPDHIVHLAGLEATNLTIDNPLALQESRCISTTDLIQSIEKHTIESTTKTPPKLWLITHNAAVIDKPTHPHTLVTHPAQTPLWGLGRVIMNEHPELDSKLVDLQLEKTQLSMLGANLLINELLDEHAEDDEILLSKHSRHVMRMQQLSLNKNLHQHPRQAQQPSIEETTDAVPLMGLSFKTPGPLKNLYWQELAQQELADNEIEIRPYATGLNFRDVMYAMGMLSDEAVENGFAGPTLGMELSGKVVNIGSNITDYRIGDEVIGFAPACFSTRVITQTTAIAHKPSEWSYAEAATIPTTFFTVYYALHHLAQIRAGEKILIHGAAGGVGIAAIQFARYKGLEVFATAGSDEKRDFVRMIGADHVLDSRSLAFADDIMNITNDEGIDVVLNSLAGEAINRNLSILKPFGRFLELGKRDFYENSKIGLRPFRNNISYFGIDADQLLIERPELAAELFSEMMQLFSDGVLRPLPHRIFPATQIEDAFRYMQQSRQIGKVIISFEGKAEQLPVPELIANKQNQPLSCDPEGCYLITGGLSGFGLETAHWLVDKGAKSIVLASRSGQVPAESEASLLALQQRDVSIEIRACDVTSQQAVNELFTEFDATLPPLKGIILAAMVLDDGLIRNMTHEQFNTVLSPKISGTWNIHQASLNANTESKTELDFFVMYSSATTALGNPGQANYVAGNMFLESLTHYRRANNLTATYAAWGAISDVGFLARNEAVKEALQSRLGGTALTSKQALAMLEKLIVSDTTGAAIIDMDWSVIQRIMPAASSPKYQELQQKVKHANADHSADIQSLIATMSEDEAQQLITEMLLTEIEHILRLPREKLDTHSSVFDLGMDSLMGMELVLAIEERFGVKLPVMALTEGATIARIAERISAQLLTPESDADVNANMPSPIESQHEEAVAIAAARHAKDMDKQALDKITQALQDDQKHENENSHKARHGTGHG